MAKKIQAFIKLQILAGAANPSPPIGPALGQKGVNIMEFCKEFNASTEMMEKGLPIPVVITVYTDRTFSFILKTPPAAVLLKRAAGIESGSEKPNVIALESVITRSQIYEIAKIKSVDMTGYDIDSVSRSIIGTARSIGLKVAE